MIKLSNDHIANELAKLQNMLIGASSNPRTPVCIILDMTGSMRNYRNKCMELLQFMFAALGTINARDLTLLIMGMNDNGFGAMFFGEIETFDCDSFIADFPEFKGETYLAQCLDEACGYLNKVAKACETSGQICTIPVLLILTDSKTSESVDDYGNITRNALQDIEDNKKLIVEFVTEEHASGLHFGGYIVKIFGHSATENISNCMRALRVVSTVPVFAGAAQDGGNLAPPSKSNREAYQDYLSKIMLVNMAYAASQYYV